MQGTRHSVSESEPGIPTNCDELLQIVESARTVARNSVQRVLAGRYGVYDHRSEVDAAIQSASTIILRGNDVEQAVRLSNQLPPDFPFSRWVKPATPSGFVYAPQLKYCPWFGWSHDSNQSIDLYWWFFLRREQLASAPEELRAYIEYIDGPSGSGVIATALRLPYGTSVLEDSDWEGTNLTETEAGFSNVMIFLRKLAYTLLAMLRPNVNTWASLRPSRAERRRNLEAEDRVYLSSKQETIKANISAHWVKPHPAWYHVGPGRLEWRLVTRGIKTGGFIRGGKKEDTDE